MFLFLYLKYLFPKSDFVLSSQLLPPGIVVSERNSIWFWDIENRWQCVSEAIQWTQSNIRSCQCTLLEIQALWSRKLPAHAQSDPRLFPKQNVISTDMSSTLSATETLSILPALSCCPSSVVLEKHQQQINCAEPSSLSSSAAYLPNNPCKGSHNPTISSFKPSLPLKNIYYYYYY